MIAVNDRIHRYMAGVAVREPEILARLRAETRPLQRSFMQIEPDQGQVLAVLVQAIGARHCLEIGTYTGYSTLAVALALPAEGRIITCDISEEWTTVARRFWSDAGVAGKIELRLAPAVETLDKLLAAGEADRFDFAFIDGDKLEYEAYYERAIRLVRPGGLIVVDNVLWDGRVADPANKEKSTAAVRAFNGKLHADPRINLCMLSTGDGMTLAYKKA